MSKIPVRPNALASGECAKLALTRLALSLFLTGVLRGSAIPEIAPDAAVGAVAVENHLSEATNSATPSISGVYGTDGLRINFRGAPLNLVLDYLSEAAGFVIDKQTDVRGNLEVWSKQPVSKNEAVDLLGSALKKAGYAMTRNGRILTILAVDSVKTADTPISVSANPLTVPKSDEVQTQVIPVQFVTVSQLLPNLEPLLPTTATISANESANTLLLVASKTDIKRILTIVQALDNSMASSASIKVKPLRYGNAKDVASLLTQLFTPQTIGQTSQPIAGNGPNLGDGQPGGLFGGFSPQASQNSGAAVSSGRGSVSGKVTAIADDRSNSVIVSGPPDLLACIETMMDKLDQPMSDLTELHVFRLRNAEASEIADQLAQLFPDPSNSSNSQAADMPFFIPPGAGQGGGNAFTATSDRMKKLGKVLAVPDPRTSSLIVTAPKSLMPQIEGMIATLDADPGKREMVSYFELRNADPQDISQNLQDLFNRNSRTENNNQNTFLGRNHPLTQRQTQNQQGSSSSSMNTGLGASGNASGSRAGQL